jgi:hypothetical protein
MADKIDFMGFTSKLPRYAAAILRFKPDFSSPAP